MNIKELRQVWQAIGCDVLQAIGNGDECITQTGEEVQSFVGDYAGTYLTGENLAAWQAADWEQRMAWLKEAFPDKELYGF